MLPCLKDFNITAPGYIRKLDNRNHWHPEEGDNDPQRRANLVCGKIFVDPSHSYCLWLVETDNDFYGVVASLIANATPQDRNIDFLWIGQQEFEQIGVSPQQGPEGKCLAVKHLHYEVSIGSDKALDLCKLLISKNRDSQRCQKRKTIAIIDRQKSIGCHALVQSSPKCDCE